MLSQLELEIELQAIWVASVAGEDTAAELSSACEEALGLTPWFARSSSSACGVINSYEEPERMGVDRWLAMLAGRQRSLHQLCVVDAGSALTIDFVGSDGAHIGGYILPGIDSMERALLSDTDRVKFSDADRTLLAPGRNTEAAVYNGLLLSQAGAVKLALEQVSGSCQMIFTGGNGAALLKSLGMRGEFIEDLVFEGLELLARSEQGE